MRINIRRCLHGHTIRGDKTPEYRAWSHAKERVTNPSHPKFENYGGRGIKMARRWLNSFESFYAEVGPRPSTDHSIDRINNNGNYEPGNVRWATTIIQRNNQRGSAA
jgi:hypothetical protein